MFWIYNSILLLIVLWFVFMRRRQIAYRIRASLWQRLQYVWIAVVFMAVMGELARMKGTGFSRDDAAVLASLWLVSHLLWRVRPR